MRSTMIQRLVGIQAAAVMAAVVVVSSPAAAQPAGPSWTAYVANFDSDTVTPINVASNVAGTPIEVGEGPAAVAITPDAATAYVVNNGSGTVTPIDVASNTAGEAIDVGDDPIAVAIIPDGSTAYVVNQFSDDVTLIDVATNTAGATIEVGDDPNGIAITPDGTTAYVVNGLSDDVTPIDLASNTAGTAIHVGSAPAAIAITPDGATVYVANFLSDDVTPIDVASNTAGTPIDAGDEPFALGVTPDGATVFVANSFAGAVTPIDVATNTAGTPIDAGDEPAGVAITPDGATAYIANHNANQVTPIDVATRTAGTPIDVGVLPLGIAITPDQAPAAALTVIRGAAGSPTVFDASASTVRFGTIASYAWDFGDGTTGSGQTTSHTYATAGSKTIGLTVTDNGGQTGSTTRNVTVTAPPTTTFVSDQFSRTVTNGFGSAPTGGAWTFTGAAANLSVGSGIGNIRLPAGYGQQVNLASVSAPQSDLLLSFGLEKAATGGGVQVSAYGRRVSGQGGYGGKAKIASNGAVTVELVRQASTGAETSIQAGAATGVTYAVGDLLNVRVQVLGTSPTTVRAKVWKVGTVEPATWQRSVTDTTAGLQASGSVGLFGYHSSSATNAPNTVRLDELVVNAP